jgi:GGDEF domain-containing protein
MDAYTLVFEMSFFQMLFRRRNPEESGSLHGEMYRLDVVEDLLSEAIRALQALMDAIAAHSPGGSSAKNSEFRKKVKQIRNLLNAKPSKPLLVEVSQQVERTVGNYSKELESDLILQTREAKQVMAIVAVMAESMADREKQYNVRFRGIGKKLRVLTTNNDLAEIRRKLEAEVTQLEKYVDEMQRDTESAVSRLQMELRPRREAQEKLAEKSRAVAPPAATEEDAPARLPPVKLVGRRDAEQSIEIWIRADRRFSAVRFHAANLKQVAAQLGLPAAAGLMEQVAERVRAAFPEAETMYRWADDDLVVLSERTLVDGAGRIAEIEPALSDTFLAGQRQVSLIIRSCIVERVPGETSADLLARIDGMLSPVAR